VPVGRRQDAALHALGFTIAGHTLGRTGLTTTAETSA